MKIIRRIILLVVLLLILGGVILYVSVDRIIKTAVQTEATSSLNLATTLDSAHLSLIGGSLQLKGLSIASPTGFSSAPLFKVGQAAVSIRYGQFHDDPIHVADITITSPALLIEYANKELNLNAAVNGMPASKESSSSGNSGSSGSTSSSDNSKPIKLIIDKLTITGAIVTVHAGSEFPDVPSDLTIPIPDITLTNIGTGKDNKNGAAIKDVVTQVTTAMWNSAIKSGKIQGAFQQMAMSKLQDLAKTFPGNVGNVIGNIAANPRNAVGALLGGGNGPTTQPANNIGNQIGNLLGGKQK